MDLANKVAKYLLISTLIVFPFGQLLRLEVAPAIVIHPIDILVGLLSATYFLSPHSVRSQRLNNAVLAVVLIFSSSLLISSLQEPSRTNITSLFYLVRLIAYLLAFLKLKHLFIQNPPLGYIAIKILIFSGLAVSLVGLAQYASMPDLRYLYYLGWDDHLYRLVSTFLDPGFTAIILVLTLLLTLSFSRRNKLPPRLMSFGLLITLAALLLTYSRASYLALFAGLISLALLASSLRKTATILTTIVIVCIPLLPRPSSEGVKLERSSTITARFGNYTDSISLIKKYPIFGVGYNNICTVKDQINTHASLPFPSHSCSGLDSSLLLILASTGIFAGSVIIALLIKALLFSLASPNSDILFPSSLAVIVSSFFSNTLFYPWIMLWLAIIWAWGLNIKGNN